MFLVRAAFWLLIVFAFLPVDRPDDEGRLPVSATEALTAAQSTFHDLAGFCDRNPGACQTGRETARLIGDRAQTGAIAVYRYFVDNPEDILQRPVHDTLSDDDRVPQWSGPNAEHG